MTQDEWSAQASSVRSAATRRAGRAALIFWALAILTFITACLFEDRNFASDILIGSIDHGGFSYLATLATAACLAIAIPITTYSLTRPPKSLALPSVFSIVTVLVLASAALAAYPALLLGALVFSREYRTIGVAGGQEAVVEQSGVVGERSIRAGLRNGAFVNFSQSTGDDEIDGRTKFRNLRFRVSTEPGLVAITYTPGPLPGKSRGVLLLPTEK